ncbi:MAG: PD-(D/E)XK nuclease domain-containing protein, partial [Flammeovirgaceae bacterium]|nr:PD-(D/E)XK nuclease domain-containing protein [Flammeovirgaceae bacterium]
AINALFASIPYQLFDQHQEKYFHAILFLAFKLCGFHIQAEVSVAAGRVDAVLCYQQRVYLFEFKLNDSAEAALRQIHQKGYYQPYLQQGKEIFLIGISFKNKHIEELKVEKITNH